MRWPSRPLRIALYSGLCIPHDAISNSLRLKFEIFDGWRAKGAPISWTAFVQHSDCDDSRVVTVPTVSELIRQSAFQEADIHLFEFGIAYGLFDAVFLLPKSRTGAVYHNVTPIDLVDDPAVRRTLEWSWVQKSNLCEVGWVACDSEYNRDDLASVGVPPEEVAVLHLPPGCGELSLGPKRADGPLDMLFVGRFVRAKGILDLLEAFDGLTNLGRPVRLTLVGNPLFADESSRQAITRAAARAGARLRIAPGLDNEALAALYRDAHVFVMPSYHEGYCVPIIEAYSAGCQVVAYDAGNLPYIVGDLGQVVEAGDVTGLAHAMSRALSADVEASVPISHGALRVSDWQARVEQHVAAHSRHTYELNLRRFIDRMIDGLGASADRVSAA
jgi:glycosyltransferase involved in cell wall biosynthesis